MKTSERMRRIGRDVVGVLPRAHAALRSEGWNPRSPSGVRLLGEVLMDEAALTGMTLTAPPPTLERHEEACTAAATELSELGVGAHADPEPLYPRAIHRQRFGRLVYERLTFDHDPLLPRSLAVEGFGGHATAAVHLCRQGGDRRPWLVWVHGAGQGQPLDLLFSRARRIQSEFGFNIALPVQPGHGVRRKAWPAYPNMDPLANVAGMMRAVSEVRAVVRWLQPQSTAIAISGVSMGSPVAALVSHLETVDAVAVYTPIFGLNAMIAQHLGRWGPSVRGRQRRAAVRNRGAVGVTSRSAGCRTVAATAASPHRRCLARPNGAARAGFCAPRTVGRRAVLARRQPRGAPLLPACAGDVGAVPCRAQCGRRPPIVRVTCSA